MKLLICTGIKSMILEAEGLTAVFPGKHSFSLRQVSFSLGLAETLCVVGESGSGKTVTALAVMGLLPPRAKAAGQIRLLGRHLTLARPAEWEGVRGKVAGMAFQQPDSCLNPVMTVGRQVSEAVQAAGVARGQKAYKISCSILEQLGVFPASRRAEQYPHQLSGGLKQRVMLAIALACNPSLLIADEPTAALDVTIQAEIVSLLWQQVKAGACSLLLVTHDLGVVSRIGDKVMVMYGGTAVEQARVEDFFDHPCHPYTKMLQKSTLSLHGQQKLGEGWREIRRVVPPTGCVFACRCPEYRDPCSRHLPAEAAAGKNHTVRCLNYG